LKVKSHPGHTGEKNRQQRKRRGGRNDNRDRNAEDDKGEEWRKPFRTSSDCSVERLIDWTEKPRRGGRSKGLKRSEGEGISRRKKNGLGEGGKNVWEGTVGNVGAAGSRKRVPFLAKKGDQDCPSPGAVAFGKTQDRALGGRRKKGKVRPLYGSSPEYSTLTKPLNVNNPRSNEGIGERGTQSGAELSDPAGKNSRNGLGGGHQQESSLGGGQEGRRLGEEDKEAYREKSWGVARGRKTAIRGFPLPGGRERSGEGKGTLIRDGGGIFKGVTYVDKVKVRSGRKEGPGMTWA